MPRARSNTAAPGAHSTKPAPLHELLIARVVRVLLKRPVWGVSTAVSYCWNECYGTGHSPPSRLMAVPVR